MAIEKKHRSILVKNILGSVAMMHIPIRNEHFSDFMFCLRVTRSDCNVIEKAKPHAFDRGGMMPRGTHNAESVLHFALDHRIHGAHYPSRCQKRHFEALFRNICVARGEISQPLFYIAFSDLKITFLMTPNHI